MEQIFKTLDSGYIKYRSNTINIIIDNNDVIWFNAKETSFALGYAKHIGAINKHTSKDDRSQLQYIDYDEYAGHPHSLYLNEAGLYKLILRSKLPAAKQFTNWVTYDVLPSIRKYGYYKLNQEHEKTIKKLNTKIKCLKTLKKKATSEVTKLKQDLKKEKFPKGGLVYVIDYSTKKQERYRIGMTTNMKNRKEVTNSHTLHKKPVVFYLESKSPGTLEGCVLNLLDDFRYRDKKDFFICSIKRIKIAFKSCTTGQRKVSYVRTKKTKSGSKTNKKQIGGRGTFKVVNPKIITDELQSTINLRDKMKKKIRKNNDKIFNSSYD